MAALQASRIGSRIYVVRDFSSLETVSMLEAQLSLSSELFLDHLDFPQCMTHYSSLYELSTVSSRQRNIAHVRLITLSKKRNELRASQSHAARRIFAEQKTREFGYQLHSEKRYGATRFRRTNVHNSKVLSVEQTISICMTHDEQQNWSSTSIDRCIDISANSSAVVVLQDQEHSLQSFRDLSWSSCSNVEFSATIPYNDALVSFDSMKPESSLDSSRTHSLYSYDSLIDWYTTCSKDQKLIARDSSFLVRQLLLTFAFFWNQSLNFIEEDIRDY